MQIYMNFKSMLGTILKKMLEKLSLKLNKFSCRNSVYFFLGINLLVTRE